NIRMDCSMKLTSAGAAIAARHGTAAYWITESARCSPSRHPVHGGLAHSRKTEGAFIGKSRGKAVVMGLSIQLRGETGTRRNVHRTNSRNTRLIALKITSLPLE